MSAQATDTGFGAGAGNNATQPITVQNVAPSIAISGAASVNEGSVYSLTLGAVTDPGTDTVTSYVVHWGDGNSDTYSTQRCEDAHLRRRPDHHARSPSIWSTRTAPSSTGRTRSRCTVEQRRPVDRDQRRANVNEGSVYTLTLGAVTDPGTDTVSSYVVHWGDGNSDTYATNGAKTHTYADGPASRAITVDLIDEDGTFLDRANAKSVSVDNVAPSIAISGATNVNEGSVYTLTLGAVTDPGTDTVTELRRPLGRRQLEHVLDRLARRRTPTPTARPRSRSPST